MSNDPSDTADRIDDTYCTPTPPPALPALTADEQADVDELHAELREHGYLDVDHHGRLRPGGRVYHRGHRWPEAAERGTGTVLVVTHKPDSSWSRSWGGPDVEVIVLWDEAPFGSRVSQVANYHVTAVAA